MAVMRVAWADRPAGREHETAEMLGAMALGICLGLVAVIGGPVFAAAGVAAVVALLLAFARPEWLILALLAMVAGVIPARFNPYLHLGGRGVYLSDLVILLLLGAVVVRLMVERGYHLPRSPLNWPMAWFLGAVVLGVLTAIRSYGQTFSTTSYDARILLYYSVFFAVTGLIRTKRQLSWLVKAVLGLALLAALSMIAQAVLGRSISLLAANTLEVETTSGGLSVLRFYNPGTVGAYVALIVGMCLLALPRMARFRPAAMLLVLITGAAVLLSLNRNLFLSAGLSLLVLLFLIRRQGWSNLAGSAGLTAGVALAGAALLAASPGGERLFSYFPVLAARFSTLLSGQGLSQADTLLWRLQEYHYAWPVILQHPIFGIGMATPYRPPFFLDDNLQSFIHNAYAWLWLKTGLLGLTAYLVIGLLFVARGLRKWQQVEPGLLRAATLGFALAFLGLAASNFVAPFFVQDWSLALIGLMFGLNEMTYALATEEGR